jgi:hypothetical protein
MKTKELSFPVWIFLLAIPVCVVLTYAYCNERLECPFCHAGRVDAQGRCSLVLQGKSCSNYSPMPQWNQWTDKERSIYTGNPGHFRAQTCWWCGHTGRMSRIDIWLD